MCDSNAAPSSREQCLLNFTPFFISIHLYFCFLLGKLSAIHHFLIALSDTPYFSPILKKDSFLIKFFNSSLAGLSTKRVVFFITFLTQTRLRIRTNLFSTRRTIINFFIFRSCSFYKIFF